MLDLIKKNKFRDLIEKKYSGPYLKMKKFKDLIKNYQPL